MTAASSFAMGTYFQFEYFVSFLSAVVAVILYFAHRERTMSHRILAIYFLCLSFMLFMHAMVRYEDIRQFPHLWRTTVFVGMLNPALAFIYVRSVLGQQHNLRRSDMLLLILPFLLALTFTQFYLQPAQFKQTVINEALADKSLYVQEREGLLPPGVSLMIRIIFALSLAMLQCIILVRWYKRSKLNAPVSEQDKTIFNWLVFFTSSIVLTFTFMSVQYILQRFHQKDYYWISSSFAMVALFITLLYLLLKPGILYGLEGKVDVQTSESGKIQAVLATDTVRRESIPHELYAGFKEKIENYLQMKKPYLQQGYKITNLSAEIGIPLNQLSSFINQEYGQSFNEFINYYRIRYIQEVLIKQPDVSAYTLEALGKKAGFNSRGTFISAMKKQTGQTPSSYIHRMGIRE